MSRKSVSQGTASVMHPSSLQISASHVNAGAKKASAIADAKLDLVKKKIGLEIIYWSFFVIVQIISDQLDLAELLRFDLSVQYEHKKDPESEQGEIDQDE